MSSETTPPRKYAKATGPSPCRLMIVGDSPGKNEVNKRQCFVGKSGRELDNLLMKILRIRRGSDWEDEVYVTDLFKWELAVKSGKKHFTAEDMVEAYLDLEEEIREVDPDVILSLGGLARDFFLGDEYDMEAVNGVPHLWNDNRVVVPCFHPAATFHRPALIQWVIEAFETVGRVLFEDEDAQGEAAPVISQPMDQLTFGPIMAVDTETDANVNPVMITASSVEGEGGYTFLADGPRNEDTRRLGEHLAKEGVITLLHNALFDLPVLAKAGIYPREFVCTMQMAFLLQTVPIGLKSLAYRLLGMRMEKYGSLVDRDKGETILDVPREKAVAYACDDSAATLGVYYKMLPMAYDGMTSVLERDCAIMPMVNAMMAKGIGVDVPFLKELEVKLIMEACELEGEIQGMVGEPDLNIGSSKQLAAVLYGKLGLGRGKRIKQTIHGGSVDAKHRKKLEGEHPVITLIDKHVEITTLLDKYLSVLPKMVKGDGRIHAQIKMANVKHSGRFAAKKPNLLAMPTRTDAGREIRNGYVAAKGFEFISLDYAQIEMRQVAHESQDAALMTTFHNNGDVHKDTAMSIFGITDPDKVHPQNHRQPAKTIGFGVLYGMTSMGLAKELQASVGPEWTEDRCEELIAAWFDVHKGVRRYMNSIYAHARRYGYVVDMWGRMTYTPEVHSAFPRTREEGLRKAGNCPIQAGAQGIIKTAMVNLERHTPYIREMYGKRLLFPIIQVHDDLLFEVREDYLLEAAKVIQGVMENAVKLSVPTPVDPKRGKRWGTMVKV